MNLAERVQALAERLGLVSHPPDFGWHERQARDLAQAAADARRIRRILRKRTGNFLVDRYLRPAPRPRGTAPEDRP